MSKPIKKDWAPLESPARCRIHARELVLKHFAESVSRQRLRFAPHHSQIYERGRAVRKGAASCFVKTWSAAQRRVALSSAEAEAHTAAKASALGICCTI